MEQSLGNDIKDATGKKPAWKHTKSIHRNDRFNKNITIFPNGHKNYYMDFQNVCCQLSCLTVKCKELNITKISSPGWLFCVVIKLLVKCLNPTLKLAYCSQTPMVLESDATQFETQIKLPAPSISLAQAEQLWACRQ